MTTEPQCKQTQHDWFYMGKEDNGDLADRCNHCKALRFRTQHNEVLRYQAAPA